MTLFRPARYLVLGLCAAASTLAQSGAQMLGAEPRPGSDVYRDFCASCHAGGWQGAPLSNDANDWSERVSAGLDAMLKNAKQGLNAMPPMGTCMDCSDEELRQAIEEMLPEKE